MAVDYSAIERAGRTRGAAFQNLGKIIGDELEEEKEITKQAKFLESQYNKGGEMAGIITDVFGGVTGVDMESKGTPSLKTFKELVRGVGGDKMVPALLGTALATYKEKQEPTKIEKIDKQFEQLYSDGTLTENNVPGVNNKNELRDYYRRQNLLSTFAQSDIKSTGVKPNVSDTNAETPEKVIPQMTEDAYNNLPVDKKAEYAIQYEVDAGMDNSGAFLDPSMADEEGSLAATVNPMTGKPMGGFERGLGGVMDYTGDMLAAAASAPIQGAQSVYNLFRAPGEKQPLTDLRDNKDRFVRNLDLNLRNQGFTGIPGVQDRFTLKNESSMIPENFDSFQKSNDLSSGGRPPRPKRTDYVGMDKGTGAIGSPAHKEAMARFEKDKEDYNAKYGNVFGF